MAQQDSEKRRELLRIKARIFRERYKANGPTVVRTEKHCRKCNATKPIDEFAKNCGAADGRASKCKACAWLATQAWRNANPNKQRKLSRDKSTRDRKLGKSLKYSRAYYARHKELCLERQRDWKANNRDAYREIQRASHYRRMAKDYDYKFACKIRSKMRLLMRSHRKSASTETLLGCKITDFRRYLEVLWQEGMSWDNYGRFGWHIDHKRPVASFDLSKPEDQRACFHYTNLQPMWAEENIRKSDSLTYDQAHRVSSAVWPGHS